MPDDDPVRKDGVDRLEDRLKAFEKRRAKAVAPEQALAVGAAYRLLASLIGGVLAGVGFGWILDHFAGTGPWGMVGGLLIGSTVSIFTVVRAAGRMSDEAKKAGPPPQSVPFDDEDED